MEFGILLIFILISLYTIFNFVSFCFRKITYQFIPRVGIKGKVIFVDDGNKKAFYNSKYSVSAIPDLIVRDVRGNNVVVEFKSRRKEILESDVHQLKASIIAARSKYKVESGLVINGGGMTRHVKAKSSRRLFSEIKTAYNLARAVKGGHVPSRTECESEACRDCIYRKVC